HRARLSCLLSARHGNSSVGEATMVFDYDWWHGDGLNRQIHEARRRATLAKFPMTDPASAEPASDCALFHGELEARTIVYLKDNTVYEIKEIAQTGKAGYLTFECQPADEAYRVGAFVVAVPFDEIARVEVFAVHPTEKPEENTFIKGFSG